MIDFSDPATRDQRLSNAERDEAAAVLTEFAAEGRLSDAEATERVTSARAAVTRADLAPLFADLPASTASAPPSGGGARAGSAGVPNAQWTVQDQQRQQWQDGQQWQQGQSVGSGGSGGTGHGSNNWKYAVAGVSPFVAVVLFFITGMLWGYGMAWLWFLLVPVVGILVYGASGWGGRERDRYRDR